MEAVDRLLAMARSTLASRERSDGWTPYGQWYADTVAGDQAFARADWCDMWVSWCADRAGVAGVVGQFAYTPWHAGWFRDQGRWGRTPKRGAIVFFDWAGSQTIGAIDHVAIVEAVEPGAVVTLEGNSAWDDVRRTRRSSGIAGFGYPNYEEADMATPEETWAHMITRPDYAADVITQTSLNAGAWLRTAAIQSWRARLAAEANGAAVAAMATALAELAADRGAEVDVDAIVARVEAAIESTVIRLDVQGPAA